MSTMYIVMKNRLLDTARAYQREAAIARINALANDLLITQEEADELIALAEQYGKDDASIEARLALVETAALEHDAALMELAEMVADLLGGV